MIDVFITSASRLDCLKETIDTMKANLITSKKFRIILHDDVVKIKESEAVEDWALNSGEIDMFIKTAPAKRLGSAITKCLPLIETELFLKWEDDWRFLKEVNLDEILGVMQNNLHINQVSFNAWDNEPIKHDIYRPVFGYDNIKLTQIQEWIVGVSVTRTSFIKSKWKPKFFDANDIIQEMGTVDLSKGRDMEWMKNNVGCYFYGGHGDGPYVFHLGVDDKIRWHHPIERA
jgi:hypothetical protein